MLIHPPRHSGRYCSGMSTIFCSRKITYGIMHARLSEIRRKKENIQILISCLTVNIQSKSCSTIRLYPVFSTDTRRIHAATGVHTCLHLNLLLDSFFDHGLFNTLFHLRARGGIVSHQHGQYFNYCLAMTASEGSAAPPDHSGGSPTAVHGRLQR